ncbi:MAG TPA: class F sortase [Mycobacteriales bacterium]|nr:class F sortase [Mycobacteriales bacterium]
MGGGALLVVLALPATVHGLQPVPLSDAVPIRQGPLMFEAAAPAAGPSSSARAVARAAPTPSAPARVRAALRCAGSPGASGRAPVRVSVPTAGINACVVGLGLRSDGGMRVPRDMQTVGWYTGGPRPGQRGPALLIGHVDSAKGPAAFFGLRAVSRGDVVQIRDKAGRLRSFVVYRVSRYAKDSFPTAQVFRSTAGAELRLVTCAGEFNRITRHYTHNLVVYARLANRASA